MSLNTGVDLRWPIDASGTIMISGSVDTVTPSNSSCELSTWKLDILLWSDCPPSVKLFGDTWNVQLNSV